MSKQIFNIFFILMLSRKQMWKMAMRKKSFSQTEYQEYREEPIRKIHFNSRVIVRILKEYPDELKNRLWWNESDYIRFRTNYELENEIIKYNTI